MSIRLRINLIVALLMASFFALVIAMQVNGARASVREEIQAANRVATQVLQRVVWVYAGEGGTALRAFLERLGRVRANELTLLDEAGRVVYRSPPSEYKAGREAPAWFAALLVPPLAQQEIPLSGGRLVIAADASRAVLDGWDDLRVLVATGGAVFVVANVLVFWMLGMALGELQVIERGLRRMAAGDWLARLPRLRAREAAAIGEAFNRMAEAIEAQRQAERRAVEAEARLGASRELASVVEQRLEQERGDIARELHDELGQAVTAIRSLALSIARRGALADAQAADAAKLIAETAGGLYDAMHRMIPRLSPLTLDSLDLGDALRDLVAQWRVRHHDIEIALDLGALPEAAGPTLKLAVYRLVQEALANALRHGQPTRLAVTAGCEAGRLEVAVSDDGQGLAADWDRPGRFGLRGMRERVAALGGTLTVANRPEGGVRVSATIAVAEQP